MARVDGRQLEPEPDAAPQSTRRRNLAERDGRQHRLWLEACRATLRQAFIERSTIGNPSDEERDDLLFKLEMLCQDIKDCLDFAERRMQLGHESEQATVAEMLRYYRRAFAALPTVARYGGLIERAVRVADDAAAGNARNGQQRKLEGRRAIVRPLYWTAFDDGGGFLDFRAFATAVERAFKEVGMKPIGDKTLKTYMDEFQREGRPGVRPT